VRRVGHFVEYRHFYKYLPVFLIFANEIWTFHFVYFSDNAFWSLSYEVWYYVAFAVAFYLGGWKRLIAFPLVLVVLGVPALFYFPAWLLGCAIYYMHRSTEFPKLWARIGFAGSIIAYLILRLTDWDDAIDNAVNLYFGGWPFAHLHNSEHFTVHWLVAAIVGVNFFCARYSDLKLLNSQQCDYLRRLVYLRDLFSP